MSNNCDSILHFEILPSREGAYLLAWSTSRDVTYPVDTFVLGYLLFQFKIDMVHLYLRGDYMNILIFCLHTIEVVTIYHILLFIEYKKGSFIIIQKRLIIDNEI